MKIHPVRTKFLSLRTDRQTGMTKLTVAYCNFAKAPKKKKV